MRSGWTGDVPDLTLLAMSTYGPEDAAPRDSLDKSIFWPEEWISTGAALLGGALQVDTPTDAGTTGNM